MSTQKKIQISFKISIIGSGSMTFTRKLISDILTVRSFQNIEISLMDIDNIGLDLSYQIIKNDLKNNNLEKTVTLTKTTNRKESLKDAKYVLLLARIGGLDAFSMDVEIPMKYGINQCVGDTLCAGGIMYGQRTIPVILDICKEIKEVGHPNALILNYMNPNAMNTWAANTFGGVSTIGLCHGVQHGHEQIAEVLGLPMDEVDIICAGINHQTWYISIKHNGVDMHDKLLEGFLNHPVYCKQEKVRIDMLKRFGYYSTESNGHLSEYLAWYRKRPEEIDSWIDYSEWIHGEYGGYLNHCRKKRDEFEKFASANDYQNIVLYVPENRSLEHASYIMEGLETGKVYRGHFNVINNGTITNLPVDSVIEAPGYVDGNGITMGLIGDLPLGCAAICNQSIFVQRMAVLAAVTADVNLLKQATLMDPLVGAVCNPTEVWAMIDEMLLAQKEWLPQYADAIGSIKS